MARRNHRTNRKWTPEEDERIIRQVRAFPQNLTRCFIIVSEELNRTPLAISNRWYTHLSKDKDNTCFFTASTQHVSRNRKNGEGVICSDSIWKRLLRVIRNL